MKKSIIHKRSSALTFISVVLQILLVNISFQEIRTVQADEAHFAREIFLRKEVLGSLRSKRDCHTNRERDISILQKNLKVDYSKAQKLYHSDDVRVAPTAELIDCVADLVCSNSLHANKLHPEIGKVTN